MKGDVSFLQEESKSSPLQLMKKGKTESLLKKDDKEYFEEKVKQAKEFTKRMKKDTKSRQKKKDKTLKEMMERIKKDQEEHDRIMKEREDEMLKKRKEETESRYIKYLEKKKERKLETKQRIEGKAPKMKYLYQEKEDKEKEDLYKALHNQKITLAEKRGLHNKPVTKEELDQHEMRFKEIKKENLAKLKKKQEEIRQKEEYQIEQLKKFKTSISNEITNMDLREKEMRLHKELERRNLREKSKTYAQIVKETVQPSVDPQKQMERLKQINKLKHPKKTPQKVHIGKDDLRAYIRTGGSEQKHKPPLQSRESSAHLPPNKNLFSKDFDTQSIQSDSKVKNYNFSYKKHPQKHPHLPRPLLPSNNRGASSHVHNTSFERASYLERDIIKREMDRFNPPSSVKSTYLQDQREKRSKQSGKFRKHALDWQRDIKDGKLNLAEKYNRIVDKASNIENEALKAEQLYRAKGIGGDVMLGENISDMFIDAIKAKLAILDEL